MADLIKIERVESKGSYGGARAGAGRKPEALVPNKARWMKARGINPLMAAEILKTCFDERRDWKRIANSADDRVVLQGLMFLMAMRDGKPAQAINVTSTHLHLSATDLEKARAIVREIRGELPAPSLGQSVDSKELSVNSSTSIMLEGDEGGNAGGR